LLYFHCDVLTWHGLYDKTSQHIASSGLTNFWAGRWRVKSEKRKENKGTNERSTCMSVAADGRSSSCGLRWRYCSLSKTGRCTNFKHCHITHHDQFEFPRFISHLRHTVSVINSSAVAASIWRWRQHLSYLLYTTAWNMAVTACEAELSSATIPAEVARTDAETVESSRREKRMLP
jgi:hypothetical protein